MRVVFKLHRSMVLYWQQDTMRTEDCGLLNIEVGCKSDWSQGLRTDELRFNLDCNTRRILVWRKSCTRNNPICVQVRSYCKRSGLIIWTEISVGGLTNQYIIQNCTLKAQKYADDILRPYVLPNDATICGSFLLIIADIIHFVLWRYLSWKWTSSAYAVGSMLYFILIWLNMFGSHSDDVFLQNECLFVLCKTWRSHFFKNITVFPKVTPIF